MDDSLKYLESQPWYRKCSRDEAAADLAKQPAGSFIIRPSRQQNCLALSHKVSNGSVGHALIHCTDKGFQLEQTVNLFPSLEILVLSVKKHYKEKGSGMPIAASAPSSPRTEKKMAELGGMFPSLSRESMRAAMQFAAGDTGRAAELMLDSNFYENQTDEQNGPVSLIIAAIESLQPKIDKLRDTIMAVPSWDDLKIEADLGECIKECKKVLAMYPPDSDRQQPPALAPGPEGTSEAYLCILDSLAKKVGTAAYAGQMRNIAQAIGDVRTSVEAALGAHDQRVIENRKSDRKTDLEFYIDLPDLDIGKEIGKGAYGVVYKGKYKGRAVAIKELNVTDKKEMMLIRREISLLRECVHPSITELVGVAQRGGALLLVMEFVDRGEFYPLLKDNSIKMPWSLRIKIAYDVASALALVHSKNLMHRDVKSENLLIDKHWNVKLCDFGFARAMGDKKKARYTICGSMYFNAPELLLGREYDAAADVFSFGILLIEMITRGAVELRRSKQNAFGLDVKALAKELPKDTPSTLWKLTACCVTWAPEKRPTMMQCERLLKRIKETHKD